VSDLSILSNIKKNAVELGRDFKDFRYHGLQRRAAYPPNSTLRGCIVPKHRKKACAPMTQPEDDLLSP
jgi:hypothetical protein